ncbi:MAG: calcium-binding protein [Alphaproteobacteria bacterium]
MVQATIENFRVDVGAIFGAIELDSFFDLDDLTVTADRISFTFFGGVCLYSLYGAFAPVVDAIAEDDLSIALARADELRLDGFTETVDGRPYIALAGIDLAGGEALSFLTDVAAQADGTVGFLMRGEDTVVAGPRGDVVEGFAGDDLLLGRGGADRVLGNGGADTVHGNAGADTLHGGQGDDRLFGGADGDRLSGDAGADTLVGDRGNDTLTGGPGADRFHFGDGSGADRIDGFDPAAGDRIAVELDVNGSRIFSAGVLIDRALHSAEGVVLDLGDGNTVLVAGWSKAALSADHLLIV